MREGVIRPDQREGARVVEVVRDAPRQVGDADRPRALAEESGQKQERRGSGGRPRPTQTQGRVRLRVADPNSIGALGSHGQSEPGGVAHDVVVGQYPRRGGSDRVGCRERRCNDVVQVAGSPLRLEELEVERLVHFVPTDIADNALLRVNPSLGAQDAVVVA